MRRGWLCGCLATFGVALGPGVAGAATLTVTTTTDTVAAGDGQCSLREAIAAVDTPGAASDCGTANATGNTIVLGPGTYVLSIAPTGGDGNTSGDLDLTARSAGSRLPAPDLSARRSPERVSATGC
jgi:CSLREA domain-containing protein